MTLPGGWELILVVLVIMVLFGSKRLPEASRSLGRSMRIFKAETKGLREDDTTYVASPVEPAAPVAPAAPLAPPVVPPMQQAATPPVQPAAPEHVSPEQPRQP